MFEGKPAILQEDRPLTAIERELVVWLLEHSPFDRARRYIEQVPELWVVSRCGCGCATVDFSYKGAPPNRKSGMDILSDFQWGTEEAGLCGIFTFARDEKLAGLEVWSIDGAFTPTVLPDIGQLWELKAEEKGRLG